MGQIREQLFRDIADDAAAELARLDQLKSVENTDHFDGEGALENRKGMVKIWELIMRRAANQCERQSLQGQPGQDPEARITITLELELTNGSLAHPKGETVDLPVNIKNIPVRVSPTVADSLLSGKTDPTTVELVRRIQSETICRCS